MLNSFCTFNNCFTFSAVGGIYIEELTAVGALLGGIIGRYILPEDIFIEDEHTINFLGYTFLAPLFFLTIGASIDIDTVLAYPIMIVLLAIVASASKLLATLTIFRTELGFKFACLLGVGLSVRFSTSVIIQLMLYNSSLISLTLYSAHMALSIILTPIIIIIYSWGLASDLPP